MPTKSILLLGGHGKVSLLMTPHLLARSWNVTSVIRNPEQKAAILSAGSKGPGKLDVLVSSLADVKTEADAKKIIDATRPDWVVWSAGAGGKGGAATTNAIDRDACIAFIRASVATKSVTKFLLVSAQIARRGKASWWDEKDWEEVQHVTKEVMPAYCKAKLKSDEVLTVLGEERRGRDGADAFQYVVLRPGSLTDDAATGKVTVGRTWAKGKISRADVAGLAAELLQSEAFGWIDVVEGEEKWEEAVGRIVKDGVNSMEGEDLEAMKQDL